MNTQLLNKLNMVICELETDIQNEIAEQIRIIDKDMICDICIGDYEDVVNKNTANKIKQCEKLGEIYGELAKGE